jgi:predicted enzyme related to lactoylglutathione lyase
MTERDSYPAGTPSWIDLGSPDTAASADFYGRLFDWDVAEAGGPETGGYRMATMRGRPVAGIGQAQSGGPPWWTTYVTVDSTDDTAKRVEEAGGQVLAPPFDVLDAGRMAVFSAPGGAVFSVWEPKQHHGSGIVNEPGALTWNELMARDLDAAKAFYGKVFEWEAQEMDMGGGNTYTLWRLPGSEPDQSIGGAMQMAGEMFPADLPDHWMVYFSVANTDASAKKVEELGGKVSVPPTDIPNVGRFAVCTGPHGEVFSIIANPAPSEGDASTS